ncbi:nucleotidyltransferase family protein [Tomitella gaofuii]|uniref:nucleotidyltransferase family protein n=1 Tax=Tomitella gaofuii TaxID=2760083 RepID=UPI0015FADE86|nr:nucleotidyltransferase domain-containing protein [Tomitella gaofuii]
MSTVSDASARRTILEGRRADILAVLERYRATNPRIFGSVARGDDHPGSDIDLLVDLDVGGGNPLLRVAGLADELSLLLGTRVDVVAAELLLDGVSVRAQAESVAL